MASLYGETNLEEIMQVSDVLQTLSRSSVHLTEDTSRKVKEERPASSTLWVKQPTSAEHDDLSPSSSFLEAMEDDEVLKGLPEKSLTDELIFLYFRNLHPFCPIINESLFCQDYFHLTRESFLQKFPPILFYAMLSVALAHADSDQLSRMGYQTVHQAQASKVAVVKRLYRLGRYAAVQQADEVILGKTCLLMSYWHPQSETETNSSWCGRAMHHTRLGVEGFPRGKGADPHRRKTLYWVSIIRNTFVNFAMRRLYRIKMDERPLFSVNEVRDEIKPEILTPMFCTADAKRIHLETLLNTCLLAQILTSMMVSRRQELFQQQWRSSESPEPGAVVDQTVETNKYVLGFLDVGKFNNQIETLIASFEDRIKEMLAQRGIKESELQKNTLNTVPLQYFRAVAHSSITTLYQPYLSGQNEVFVEACQRVALVKVKEASMKVAKVFESLLEQSNIESIPVGILGWAALPTAALLIGQRQKLLSLSPKRILYTQLLPENGPHEAYKMLKLCQIMATRHEVAQYIWAILEEISRLTPPPNETDNNAQEVPQPNVGAQPAPKPTSRPVSDDLDLLVQATKLLDLNLSYEGPRPSGNNSYLNHFDETVESEEGITYALSMV